MVATRAWQRTRHLALILGVTSTFGCTSAQLTGISPVQVVIVALEGGPAGNEAAFRNAFQSDVVTAGRAIEDDGRVVLALSLKDPGTADLPTRPSAPNFVTLTRYRVRYLRADGRATPGLDVPFSFDGGMTFTVGPDGGVGRFVLVRAQSKMEPPLAALREGGGAVVLSTLAEVTFFGSDQAGHEISVAGLIGVNFADWADHE